MTKYLDSPLKVAGTLLTLAGICLQFFALHQSLPESLSIVLMGVLMLLTAWMITHSRLSRKYRHGLEISLLMLTILCSLLMALDYYGLIAIHRFLSVTGIRDVLTSIQ